MAPVLPPLLNYTRSIVPSNGFFYYFDEKNEKRPVLIDRQTVRGTISNYSNVYPASKAKKKEDLEKDLEKRLDPANANIQPVDICYLPYFADTFLINFSVKFLNNSREPGACSSQSFRKHLIEFYELYCIHGGFDFLSQLYLKNIINARWFWRNRVSTEKSVTIATEDKQYEFTAANDLSQAIPEQSRPLFDEIAVKMASSLAGESEPLTFNVTGSGKIGSGQEIYPSQEFIDTQSKNKGKVLASAKCEEGRQAKMHSQKIGNAIRTIDTWYPDIDENPDPEKHPAPVEPYGVFQHLSLAARLPGKNKSDLYSYLKSIDKLIKNNKQELNNDAHYVMACLIRGGVFSGEKKTQ